MVNNRISETFCGIITHIETGQVTLAHVEISGMARPKIKITIKERKGTKNCHRGHKVGDSYDFDTERGKLCPMVMHVLFPAIDILRYGGSLPGGGCNHKGLFACPDPDTLLVFKVEKID